MKSTIKSKNNKYMLLSATKWRKLILLSYFFL